MIFIEKMLVMNIYLDTKLPDKNKLYELFLTTDWNKKYRLDVDELFLAIKKSWYVISAYENDQLVGFGRIICDGVVHALILDMIVHPLYQRRGIGRKVLSCLVNRCLEQNIRDIQLFCAKGKADFYIKNGFQPRPKESPGMEFKKIRQDIKKSEK